MAICDIYIYPKCTCVIVKFVHEILFGHTHEVHKWLSHNPQHADNTCYNNYRMTLKQRPIVKVYILGQGQTLS